MIIIHKRKSIKNAIKSIKRAYQYYPDSDSYTMEKIEEFVRNNVVSNSQGKTIKPLNLSKIIRKFLLQIENGLI